MADMPTQSLRPVWQVPPGATMRLNMTTGEGACLTPIWTYWLQVAVLQAGIATEARPSDAMVDYNSAQVHGMDRERPEEPDSPEWSEMLAGMVAVSAAAHAIDGLYGAVKPMVAVNVSSAPRWQQILETLRHGFLVREPTRERWSAEFEWLFDKRDAAVHHGEEYRPLVVERITAESIVHGAPESEAYQAANARRAAGLAVEVVRFCVEHPKPATAEWVAGFRRTGFMRVIGLEPDPSPPDE